VKFDFFSYFISLSARILFRSCLDTENIAFFPVDNHQVRLEICQPMVATDGRIPFFSPFLCKIGLDT